MTAELWDSLNELLSWDEERGSDRAEMKNSNGGKIQAFLVYAH